MYLLVDRISIYIYIYIYIAYAYTFGVYAHGFLIVCTSSYTVSKVYNPIFKRTTNEHKYDVC